MQDRTCRYAKRYLFEDRVHVAWPYKGKRYKMALNCGCNEETIFIRDGEMFFAVSIARHLLIGEVHAFNHKLGIQEDSLKLCDREFLEVVGRDFNSLTSVAIAGRMLNAYRELLLA